MAEQDGEGPPHAAMDGRPDRSAVLATDETVARRARVFVTEALAELGRPELAEGAALLVSELVTNVARHTNAGSCTICLGAHGAGSPLPVIIEVTDPADAASVVLGPPVDDRQESGRGLRIVAALADDWGVRRADGEKSVWFRLGS